MKSQMRKILGWSAATAIAVATYSCFAGQASVVDEVTGKPMAGVQVVIYWQGRMLSPVQSPGSSCFGLTATRSDANGKFDVPVFSGNINPLMQDRIRIVDLAVSGYRESKSNRGNSVSFSMRPLADPKIDPNNAEEDRKYFQSYNAADSCADPKKLTLPLLKVIYQNLELLANNSAEREALPGYLRSVDRLEFGERIADQNYAARILEFRKLEQNKDVKK